VVTDGFTGNVCLKVSESLAEMLTSMIRESSRATSCRRRARCWPSARSRE
jgi:fatty acid/phospholipid biosynthesis enzyme